MGYKYFVYLKDRKMKKKWLLTIVFVLGLHWVINGALTYAQNPIKTLTLLYSNNINGEIEPCPT